MVVSNLDDKSLSLGCIELKDLTGTCLCKNKETYNVECSYGTESFSEDNPIRGRDYKDEEWTCVNNLVNCLIIRLKIV